MFRKLIKKIEEMVEKTDKEVAELEENTNSYIDFTSKLLESQRG